MNKLIILCVFGILSLSILSWNISRASEIPPTPAFSKIVTANGTITALNYSTPLKVIAGSNVTITVNNPSKTLTISAKGSSSGNSMTVSNLSGAFNWFSQIVGNNIQLRGLNIGPGLTSSQNSTTVTLDSKLRVNTISCTNGISGITNTTGLVSCMQYSPIQNVKQVSLRNQNSSIPLTTLFTPNSNGTYRISVYQVDSQSAIAGTLSTTISWTDETNTNQNAVPAPNLSVTLLGGFSQGSVYIDSKSSQNISYQTTLSGVTGTPKYSLYITVEKLS